jgi:hypothetical protein
MTDLDQKQLGKTLWNIADTGSAGNGGVAGCEAVRRWVGGTVGSGVRDARTRGLMPPRSPSDRWEAGRWVVQLPLDILHAALRMG